MRGGGKAPGGHMLERMREVVAPGENEALWDLQNLARAEGLGDWMFDQFAPRIGPRVAEVGAGIGTFSKRLLATGVVEHLLLIEPEPACAEILEDEYSDDERVRVTRDALPDAESLHDEGDFDLVLCQNVLEHIDDHHAAVRSMADALRPGGSLTLLVPAHPRLYGSLDRRYGHFRRYTRPVLREAMVQAELEVEDLYSFNLLGVPGWWVSSRRSDPSLSSGALGAYELLLRAWRPIEDRVRVPWGLSLVAHGRKPR